MGTLRLPQKALEAINASSPPTQAQNVYTIFHKWQNALVEVRKRNIENASLYSALNERDRTIRHLEAVVGALRAQLMEKP